MRKLGDMTPPKNSSFLTAELKDTEVGDVKFYEEKKVDNDLMRLQMNTQI